MTKEKILEILRRHTKENIQMAEEEKQKILNNPMLAKSLEKLERCREYHEKKPIYTTPFSMFKRYEDDGDRTEFEYSDEGYFVRRGRLETYVIRAWLYGEKEDIRQLENIMWAICDEYTWSLPAHMHGQESLQSNLQEDLYTIDLFAAETGDTLAEAMLLVGDKLSPIVVKRAKREIKKRITDRFLSGNFGWERTTNNWAAVCAGSVGMAAMCEVEDSDVLAQIIERLLSAMDYFKKGFAEDGSCLEGVGYWNYGFGYFTAFAEMLYRYTKGEINLFDDEKYRKVALFLQKSFLYGSRTVSFSDSGSYGSVPLGMVTKLSEHYEEIRIPEGARFCHGPDIEGCHRFALAFREYLWMPNELPKEKGEFGCYVLPHAQWYVASGKDNVGVAAKAGKNNEPHNHNDVGHFIVYKEGEEFFADLGSGEYTRQYFAYETRYKLLHCGSHGHSVPIINGTYQYAAKEAAAKDVQMGESGISMDISDTYKVDTMKSLYRDIRFDKDKGSLKIKDKFTFNGKPDSITERFVTLIEPEITGNKVVLKGNKSTMTLSYDADIFEASAWSSVEPDHMGKPFTVHLIDLKVKNPSEKAEYEFIIE